MKVTPVFNAVVHPWLCDVMGHLTTRHYVAFFDDASYFWLNKLFSWNGEQAEKEGVGFVDVKHTIEYQDEAAAGTLLEIRASLIKVGGKSLTTRYEMINQSTEAVVATLESVCVFFDTKNRKAIALTDEMRNQAQGYQ
ncbi:acyl-CoA thioesterase [Temperatibacter marinus]|uniref:Acyl-CoA thioesterase n=1 Tax=Temperatibacter marinus TaxID=1456591 RepID=A0AA52H9I6_9PROT|nr:acyl-CoA thioesterase [Temperatibacter marinus]WND02949.1 acyl-CoA thioesterase [Temperatibacter marinus]